MPDKAAGSQAQLPCVAVCDILHALPTSCVMRAECLRPEVVVGDQLERGKH